jgi:16S rRNA (guanine(966)-N(2))-methyltransferase RsmD
MRITSGTAKGYKLKVPAGDRVRPAQDIVRQAIFNIIGEHIVGAKVLDIFAGSGSLGIEALSRGAAWCDLVDKDKKCTAIIKENLRHTNFEEKSKVYTMRAEKLIDQLCKSLTLVTAQPYDFIFLSPPYAQGIDFGLLENLAQVLRSGGVVIFEHSKETTMPTNLDNLKLLDQRTYGAATVSFLQNIPKG